MFSESSVFILSTDGKVYRLEVERSSQISICDSFSTSLKSMVQNKSKRIFTVNYMPEDDELLCIEDFVVPEPIKDAIRYPLTVDTYRDYSLLCSDSQDFSGFPGIKAIFTGECIKDENGEHFNIVFQRYRKEQNFITVPFRLFYSNDTFKRENHFCLGITDSIDCYYADGELQFESFYYARQIFNLRDYYRIASDSDVDLFINSGDLLFEKADGFRGMANSYIRRKIAMINDSQVLKNYNAKKIQKLAKISGIDIKIQSNKIVIPAEKQAAIEVMAFLDEEAYTGPFSNDLLIANSKRVSRRSQRS